MQRFLRILRVDALIFIFILVCASLLGSLTPPRDAPHHHAPEETAMNTPE